MAEVEEVLAARLVAVAAVQALVSGRVYPITRPQDIAQAKSSCVVYERTENQHVQTLTGPTDLGYPEFRFTAWGSTYAAAKAVWRAVFDGLERWGDATTSPVIFDCRPTGYEEDYDDDTEAFWCSQMYEVWYRES